MLKVKNRNKANLVKEDIRSSSYRAYFIISKLEFVFFSHFDNLEFAPTFWADSAQVRSMYKRAPKFLKDVIYDRIYNEVESGWYTFDDLACYGAYLSLFSEKLDPTLLDKSNIDEFKHKYFNEMAIDKLKIDKIEENLKLGGIKEYFKINCSGDSHIGTLVMNKVISPRLFIEYSGEKLANMATLFKKSKTYLRLVCVSKFLKTYLKP